MTADVILVNGRFATLDPAIPDPQAVAITGGKFSGVGTEQEVRALVARECERYGAATVRHFVPLLVHCAVIEKLAHHPAIAPIVH